MGWLNWLFGGKPGTEPAPPPAPPTARPEPAPRLPAPKPCPHCGGKFRQARKDGRCVACGKPLPAELRAPPEASTGPPPRPQPLMDGLLAVTPPGSGVMMAMDPMAHEHLSTENDKPDPSQQALNDLLAHVARIRVWAGGMLRDNPTTRELLVDEAEPAAVESFRQALRILEDPNTFGHCACLGQPTIELLDPAGHRVGTLGMQHGGAVRWYHWKHDARLVDGRAVVGWLTEHGVPAECLR